MADTNFFKILNSKIHMYDKIAQNPFENKRLIIVWVEDVVDDNNNKTSLSE